MDAAPFTTLGEVRDRWIKVNEETDRYINSLTDTSLKEIRTFTRMNGKQEAHPLWKLLMHTANHGTHTRGQIIASIRRFGYEPGNIDLIHYIIITNNA
jgi:uncharacterized damage-inducible protein DinB